MPVSVLIVEDEFIVAEDIKLAVQAGGYVVFGIAYTYQQAIDLMQNDKPDIVLVDITLDRKQSGILLGALLSGSLSIPYAYLTAHADPATMRKVEATRPGGFIVKPFKRESLYKTLTALSAYPYPIYIRPSAPAWLLILKRYLGCSGK